MTKGFIYDLDNETIDKAREEYRNYLRDHDEEIKSLAGFSKAKAIFKKANVFFEKESPELRKFLEERGYLQPEIQTIAKDTKIPNSEQNMTTKLYDPDKETINKAKEEYRNYLRDHDEEIKALYGMAKTKAIFKKANAFFEKESPELREFLEERGYLLPAPQVVND
ncbi:hypothetical protein TVAG_163230 [Trichomonas vaginalis G3]|uniref:Uncharacterized protein n=1 Tax=Trichomonas vaginalis (strain ATCC PRA-98 / G3) TaxID=412133 RepID=A2DG00_TRIV3|nr:hypothetical protein TVAGG3_0953000 [Trichomonas vaginalis G3]EAY20627.1 hypothetical protein TVAG_163230 [Trichomonas vaginalis G3]KAI5487342.1 hypothetical protein TVAGG3_0953000 [Trichomonas vaginalis G3]|eukprot:XP_001581613.1 hypothetical protein [Trichomonas vaginalis G3]